jgi:CheY-like chemotaxis protein
MREYCRPCLSYSSLKDFLFSPHKTAWTLSNKMRTADHISLVLLDLWMPVMDGWEFLRRKRSDSDIAEIPVVVLSAVPPVSLDGAWTVLKKPVDINPW